MWARADLADVPVSAVVCRYLLESHMKGVPTVRARSASWPMRPGGGSILLGDIRDAEIWVARRCGEGQAAIALGDAAGAT
jgi:hypothetical protein